MPASSSRSRSTTTKQPATKPSATRKRTTTTRSQPQPNEAPPPSNGSAPEASGPREHRFIYRDATTYPTIHVLQAMILDELPPIPKDRFNEQQRFHFRGIDDTLVALNPVLAKYGVRIIPHHIRQVEYSTRTSAQNKPVYTTNAVVVFRWYGPAGDYIEAEGIGEGTDSLDKDASKAVQMAYKYMIFQALSIATRDAVSMDADRGPSTVTIHPTLAALIERHEALPDDLREKVALQICDKVWNGERWAMTEVPEGWWPWYESMVGLGEKRVVERAVAAQDADAEGHPNQPPSSVDRPAEQTPVTGPVVDTPPSSPEPATTPQAPAEPTQDEPSTDAPSDGDAVTWDQVQAMGAEALRQAIKAVSEDGKLPAKSTPQERLAETYWLLIGGTFEPDDAEGFPCPEECGLGPFDTSDELYAHMTEAHDDGSAEDPDATNPGDGPTADDVAAWDAQPADADTLKIVEEEVSKLRGVAARSYATYRKEKGLPPAIKDLTKGQALELLDFFERLPA